MMREKIINHPPMIISKIIPNRPPITNRTFKVGFLKLGFTSNITLEKPPKILAIIPSHPIKGDTTPEETKTIEKASVPRDHKNCVNLNLESFVLRMVRAKSLNEFSSAPLVLEYCLAILRSPQ